MNNIESKRISLTLPTPLYEALCREAMRTGRRVATYCNNLAIKRAEEIIEEEKKKANEGR